MDSSLEMLKKLIGCRIKTHYGTGGIVKMIPGRNDIYDNAYTIIYENEKGKKSWINSIRVEKGIITCEHIPLKILNFEKQTLTQLSLFDYFVKE